MKVVYNSEMKSIEKEAIENYGISEVILMENAGKSVSDHIVFGNKIKTATIVCGTGNNGGDGFVCARHLHNNNIDVRIFIVGNVKDINGSSLDNLNILRKMEIQIENIKELNNISRLEKSVKISDATIDCVFGTGFHGELNEPYISSFDAINKFANHVISVDIPSGIIGNTGYVAKGAIVADETVSFCVPKLGNILFPGSDNNGKIIVRDIGIPKKIIEKSSFKCNIIDKELVVPFFPRRSKFSHKGDFGKVNAIAGSTGLTGAAILTCRGALRSGIGLLKLYIPESLTFLVTHSVPEVIVIPIQEVRKGVIGINYIDRMIKESEDVDCIAIGPGCGNTGELGELVRRFLKELERPIVIDADGLNTISKNIELFDLKEKKAQVVFTPHLGEMSRLTGLSIEEISGDVVGVAKKYAAKWDVVLVLKGARTIIASPNGDIYINVNGNSGMATAGSGDVLTGIISGFIAQGLTTLQAAILGVYLHGRAGDYAAELRGEYGLLAGDIVEGLIYILKEMSQNK